ncbi:hypothetical protein PYW07_014199 [Mythimna separata]|uniref:Uncharacterized protein n=1 Tax=Mythimna separata TaxID=271217 RepID=A0AAD7Z058_MYTSE|nr:hypothetical protein PYW07_014199 [Mythimna separata]
MVVHLFVTNNFYGYIMCRPMEYVGRRCTNMVVLEASSRGRPRKRSWLEVVKSDMRANGVTEKDVENGESSIERRTLANPGLTPGGRNRASGVKGLFPAKAVMGLWMTSNG